MKKAKVILSVIFICAGIFACDQGEVDDILKNLKGPQDEAQVNLASIYAAQRAYFGEKGTYANTFALLDNWTPETLDGASTRYSYFLGGETIINTKGATHCGAPVAVLTDVTQNAFTASASGNIDDDQTCDDWYINDAPHLTNSVNDKKN